MALADHDDVLRRVRRVLGGAEEAAQLERGANAEQGKEIVGRGAEGNEHASAPAPNVVKRLSPDGAASRERARGMLEGVVRHPPE